LIPDYLDFRDVEEKVRAKSFDDVYEFVDMVRQIFDNAMKFNPPISRGMWCQSWKLSKRFESKVLKEIVPLMHDTYPKLHTQLKILLSKIVGSSDSKPFREPCNYIKMNIPDYAVKVDKPFCLKQVEHRLWSYQTPEDFLEDMEIIWGNAMLYFEFHHPVYQQAMKVKEKTLQLMEQHFPDWDLSGDMEVDEDLIEPSETT